MDKPIKSQVHLVTPAIPSSPGWNYELTNLDLINWIPRPEYHELVFFFRDCVSPHHGERELHQGLKSSLSKALAEFPVLAGRICHGEAPFKLKVNVNSQGVNVIESRSDASLDEWSDLRQCPISVDFSLSGDHADLSQMPLMQVQVTTFRCGGVAIGFHFLHMVMDGYSLVKFLTRWSEIHRGVSPVNPRNRQDFTTAVLKARSSPLVDAPVPFVVEHAQQDALGFDFGGAEEHEATTFETVSALLWSSITAAKAIPEHLDTSYMLPINLRSKASLHWKRGLLSTSLGRFPVYGIDFGWRGGALAQLCLLPTALPPSFVALFPAPAPEPKSIDQSRGVDIHIRLAKTHKEKLLNDVFFTRNFADKEISSWSKSLCKKALKVAVKA
ncbi:hypothetical protein SELMODRAFT_420104 [Selaginella moellendorffii]|uniref:BAHD family acyltransferase n=1 Tax=Selaginella moellendorffii TaxID=88036 RepID=D8SAZ6_SELML|nr:hypothetical protein SELMODRAFT_420104 [Selaginella moellendorffii]